MIDIKLPVLLTQEFINLIPRQREVVNMLFEEGKILSYTLSENRARLWIVVVAEDEEEVKEILEMFPLAHYMQSKIYGLMFHNMISAAPAISLN
jgi:muconolactone delta-isomerase